MWLTPVIAPPHPSQVPTLSPFALQMLKCLREERFHQAEPRPRCNYRAIVAQVFPKSYLANTTVQQRHEQELLTADDIFEDQFVENKNEVRNWEINVPNYSSFNLDNTGKEIVMSDLRNTMNNKYICSLDSKNQQPLNSKDVVFQEVSHNQAYLSDSLLFNVMPHSEVTDMNKQSNYFDQLSPVMEFDDLKIYSLPHNTETTTKTGNIIFEGMDDTNENHEKKTFDNFETVQKNKNVKSQNQNPSFHGNIYSSLKPQKPLSTINFKEVKIKRLQSERILHQKLLNIEPSDQHFSFTIPPSTQKFKKKLAQYKVANNKQNRITEFFKRKETPDTALQITIGNCGRKGFEVCSDMKSEETNEYSIGNGSGNIATDKTDDLIKNSDEFVGKVNKNYILNEAQENIGQHDKIIEFKQGLGYTENDKGNVIEDGNTQFSELSECFFVNTQDFRQSNSHKSGTDNKLESYHKPKSGDKLETDYNSEVSYENVEVYKSNQSEKEVTLTQIKETLPSHISDDVGINYLLSLEKSSQVLDSQKHKPNSKEQEKVVYKGKYDKLKSANVQNATKETALPVNDNLHENLFYEKEIFEVESLKVFKPELKNSCRNNYQCSDTFDIQTPFSGQNNFLNTADTSFATTQVKPQTINKLKTAIQDTQNSNSNFSHQIRSHENEFENHKKRKTSIKKSIEVNVDSMQERKVVRNTNPLKQPSLSNYEKFITPDTLVEDQNAQCSVSTNTESQTDAFNKPKPPVKQKRVSDCMKFQKSTNKVEQHGSNSIKTESDQFHSFKKPKSLPKRSTLVKNAQQVQFKQDDQNYKSRFMKNGWLYTSSDEKLSHLGFKKMIQTSLVKVQETKSPINEQQKPKKISHFIAPIKASHSTSQEIKLKNYTITILDEVSAKEILQKFESDKLNKMLITVTFKEGYTLLNKPLEPLRNSGCLPSGVMFQAFWFQGSTKYYYLNLMNPTSSLLPVIHKFLTTPVKVVCFEIQAVYVLLMDVFHIEDTTGWMAFDPLVGCWLLDPDNPVTNFAEVLKKLELDNELLIVSCKADIKTQACDLLPVLDITMDIMEKRLSATSLWMVFTELEMKLTPLLAIMECSSISVDVRKLHETSRVIDKRLKKLQKEAYELVGHPFQLNSHQQLRKVLFDELKLDAKFNVVVKQTEQGAKSTSEVVLCQLKSFHPLPKIILEQRHLQKVKSTYVDGLQQFVRKDGTMGSTWEQTGAATGRITSKNPNLQAIPKVPVMLQDQEKIYLRAIFKSREGFSFLAADFQQIEFRVFAHFTQDKNIIQMFRDGGDIFTRLAGQWLGRDGGEEREKIKRIVYSVMYGAGPQKLAEYLHVDIHEAERIITNFVDTFPCLRTLPQIVIAQCRRQGYLVTVSGRRRLFPNIRSTNSRLRTYAERQAINFLIQGSAADICKAAMLDSHTALSARGLQAKLLLQIHDELVWEVADHHLQETADIVQRAMEDQWNQRLSLRVPVPVSISSGKTLANLELLDH